MSKCEKGCCKHKFVQGKKKGTFCNKPCRNDNRCKMHKKNNIERRKEYYKEVKQDKVVTLYDTVKQSLKKGEEVNLDKFIYKKDAIKADGIKNFRRLVGIYIFLGKMTVEEAFDRYDKKLNKRLYYIAEQEAKKIEDEDEEAKLRYDYNSTDSDDSDVSDDLFDNSGPHQYSYKRRYEHFVSIYRSQFPLVYIEYNGNKQRAKKLLVKYENKKKDYDNKYNMYENIIKLIKKKKQKDEDIVEV
jgi:hypothetical protein